jgi:hypothetical protein
VQIAKKLGISDPVVGGLLALHKAGEERLLEATISGRIPLSGHGDRQDGQRRNPAGAVEGV